MQKEVYCFVEFLYRGLVSANKSREKIDSLDPYSVIWPEAAYAFRLYKREDILDGEKRYEGKEERVGPTYYHPDSKLESLEEVKRNPDCTSVLITNMECNGYEYLVWSRFGTWPQFFESGRDCILENRKGVQLQ